MYAQSVICVLTLARQNLSKQHRKWLCEEIYVLFFKKKLLCTWEVIYSYMCCTTLSKIAQKPSLRQGTFREERKSRHRVKASFSNQVWKSTYTLCTRTQQEILATCDQVSNPFFWKQSLFVLLPAQPAYPEMMHFATIRHVVSYCFYRFDPEWQEYSSFYAHDKLFSMFLYTVTTIV